MKNGILKIATCQFADGYDPHRNAAVIRGQIARAKKMRADVVHFHECALTGYSWATEPIKRDWQAWRKAAESICNEARRQKIWVILGSAHPLTPPHKPHNSLYVITPAGVILDRYDKRFLMPGELEHYTPGNRFVTFTINGVKCGLLICFDLRFPELYRQLLKRGVRVVFQSFYNARMDGPGVHEHIMRQTLQAHAACNSMWLSAPNSTNRFSRWSSVFITPDGVIAKSLPRHRAGVMVNTVDLAEKFYDPVSPFRHLAINGTLHNGRLVKDPRSSRVKSF